MLVALTVLPTPAEGRLSPSYFFPSPFIAHRISVFKEKDFSPVWCSYWENASRASPLRRRLLPLALTACLVSVDGLSVRSQLDHSVLLSQLVDVFLCWDDWLGLSVVEKVQRASIIVDGGVSRPGDLDGLQPASSAVEKLCPRTLSPRHSSAKHNTNLFPQTSVQVPLFISLRTQIPVASHWLSFFLLPPPLAHFHPSGELRQQILLRALFFGL